MKLETVDISDISQDPANVRKHSDRNLEAIAASLRAFGQQKPIVVDGRNIILAGNGTYEAAKRIGWDKIKIARSNLSGTEATAYAIADNRTSELAEWDDTALAEQLRSLQSEEFDLAKVGYTDDEVDELIEKLGQFDVEAIEPPILKDGDRAPIQQMTFTLHDEQAEVVKLAISAAKDAGPFVNTGNENSNGNALARVAEAYIGQG